MIPYGRQDISPEDIQAVVDVLKSDYLTQGPAIPHFEEALCTISGAKYSVVVNSATSALHIACLALDLGPGDWLWTSPITFVASANAGLYCGASVDFVDIDPVSYNMSVDALREKLERAKEQGRLPKVVVPVHLCGQSCDMEQIGALAEEYGFRVIEDASHAVGGSYHRAPVGTCQHSDITIFSFHPVKIVTTAEGGAAMTNNPNLARKMDLLRSHGITRDPELMTHESDGPWYYQQVALGLNYRMTDIHAALGVSQLKRLEEFVARRNALSERYDALLADMPLQLPRQGEDRVSARHLYVILLDLESTRHSHHETFEKLRDAGIGVNLHYIPVHKQPYYRNLGVKYDSMPVASDYYSRAISIPLYSAMSEEQQNEVVHALKDIL